MDINGSRSEKTQQQMDHRHFSPEISGKTMTTYDFQTFFDNNYRSLTEEHANCQKLVWSEQPCFQH